MSHAPTAIIGVGNYLMGDEGVGIHAIEALRKLKWPDDVELIDGGTPGVALLHLLKGRNLVIIIDCAGFGGTPGEIRSFNPEDLKRDERAEVSLHATDLLSALELAKLVENYPKKLVIIGIQPEKIEMGTALSPALTDSIRHLQDEIGKQLHCKQKSKIQNPKSKINPKLKIPNPKKHNQIFFWILDLGFWIYFEFWILDLGFLSVPLTDP